jgi:hypothetical protein
MEIIYYNGNLRIEMISYFDSIPSDIFGAILCLKDGKYGIGKKIEPFVKNILFEIDLNLKGE